MQALRRAVIDVGTNSVKLLVADLAGPEIRRVCEESRQTRLGRGFYATHRLRADAIAATTAAVAAFAARARKAGAASIRVIATSAAREAVNRAELLAAIAQATGLRVEVISGDQEADWGFAGVSTDPQLGSAPVLILDVGGGSAQFIFGAGGKRFYRQSFALGAVRLRETLPCHEPPRAEELAATRRWLQRFLQAEVMPPLAAARAARRDETAGAVQLVGVGGTASVLGGMEAELATFDPARLEATRLSAARVTWHVERLWGLPLPQRRRIIGLPPNRADIILMGAAIFEAVMQAGGFGELRLSTRSLRFAALRPDPAPAA